jgi:hypothetical protein
MEANHSDGPLVGNISRTPRVLIAGTTRNPKRSLNRTVSALTCLLSRMDVYFEFFVVESDSKPPGLRRLKNLSKRNAGFKYISLGNLSSQFPNRVSRIAKCRNEYMRHLELGSSETFTHLMVVDFDGVSSSLRVPTDTDTLFRHDTAVTGNQIGRYYDILAFRRRNEMEQDYRLTMFEQIASGQSAADAYLQSLWKFQKRISAREPEFSVESAFGGIAVYPAPPLVGIRYTPGEIGKDLIECEHVSFSSEIRKRGLDIIILPTLQNRGSKCHTLMASVGPKIIGLLRLRLVDLFLRRISPTINAKNLN